MDVARTRPRLVSHSPNGVPALAGNTLLLPARHLRELRPPPRPRAAVAQHVPGAVVAVRRRLVSADRPLRLRGPPDGELLPPVSDADRGRQLATRRWRRADLLPAARPPADGGGHAHLQRRAAGGSARAGPPRPPGTRARRRPRRGPSCRAAHAGLSVCAGLDDPVRGGRLRGARRADAAVRAAGEVVLGGHDRRAVRADETRGSHPRAPARVGVWQPARVVALATAAASGGPGTRSDRDRRRAPGHGCVLRLSVPPFRVPGRSLRQPECALGPSRAAVLADVPGGGPSCDLRAWDERAGLRAC